MTEETVDEPFDAAAEKIETAYQQAATDVKSKLVKAKSAALKKISS